MSIKGVKQIGARIGGDTKKNHGGIDAEAIRELAHLLTETGLTEIEIEQAGHRVRVARMGAPMAAAHAITAPVAATAIPASETSAPKKDGLAAGAVTSPMVGTVYVSPEPGKPPFVKVGDKVKEGDTLLIVEAMKTMNPILAPRGGTISEICIHDAQPVEFGQALVVLN
ncbi:MAG TPA: acetyl-CoA carboxylase biotin carboxyl carrier protein [Rhizomicrobium sp.]|nr:acetyl-CoA carboxylase biotin carboxyl carrier protein [Rhizomicrobium sp.]